jgi:hypothetical protein
LDIWQFGHLVIGVMSGSYDCQMNPQPLHAVTYVLVALGFGCSLGIVRGARHQNTTRQKNT